MKYERRYPKGGADKKSNPDGEEDMSVTEEKVKEMIDMSKRETLDMLKKQGGGKKPLGGKDMEMSVEEVAEKAAKKVLGTQREVKEQQEQITEAVEKKGEALMGKLDERLGQFESKVLGQIKGVPKEEAKAIVDEELKKACEDPNSPFCQVAKTIAKGVVEESLRGKKEETGFEMPKISPEFEVHWKELSPEDRKKLTLIPRDAHQTMLEIITEAPESHKGLNRKIFENLTEEEITELVREKPELVAKLPGAVCTTPECKEAWNKAVKENPNIKDEEKSHWLLT